VLSCGENCRCGEILIGDVSVIRLSLPSGFLICWISSGRQWRSPTAEVGSESGWGLGLEAGLEPQSTGGTMSTCPNSQDGRNVVVP